MTLPLLGLCRTAPFQFLSMHLSLCYHHCSRESHLWGSISHTKPPEDGVDREGVTLEHREYNGYSKSRNSKAYQDITRSRRSLMQEADCGTFPVWDAHYPTFGKHVGISSLAANGQNRSSKPVIAYKQHELTSIFAIKPLGAICIMPLRSSVHLSKRYRLVAVVDKDEIQLCADITNSLQTSLSFRTTGQRPPECNPTEP